MRMIVNSRSFASISEYWIIGTLTTLVYAMMVLNQVHMCEPFLSFQGLAFLPSGLPIRRTEILYPPFLQCYCRHWKKLEAKERKILLLYILYLGEWQRERIKRFYFYFKFYSFFLVLETEPRTLLYMPGKYSTTKLYPQCKVFIFNNL